MRMRASHVAAALSLAFAANANATIVGSTYNFAAAPGGSTQIAATNGTYTDPTNPGFCVGPPLNCAGGNGLSGSFDFDFVNPTLDTITFSFFGSTDSAGPGSFSILLSNFVTLDGEVITGVSLASGSLGGATLFPAFNGGAAVFQWVTASDYNAIGGNTVVFNVATTGPQGVVPEPASLALLGVGLAGLAFSRRKQQ